VEQTVLRVKSNYVLADPLPEKLRERFSSLASPLLLQLLWNRGWLSAKSTKREVEHLLSPDFERDLHDPLLIPGMTEAVGRIEQAIEGREAITVYGDYDADGIPGTALLVEALGRLGARVDHLVPQRELDGYGLSRGPIDRLVERGTRLIVTVDCGIRSREAVAYARSKGMDVIVTDHHQIAAEDLPEGVVVHPALPGSMYPNPHLSGAGVAYKFVSALAGRFPERLPASYLKWALDLVAISTVADLVPLTGENRALVHFGLIVLGKSRRPGLEALYREGAIDPATVDSRTIGFGIGPRVNAPGRLATAEESLQLLLTEDTAEARRLAQALQRANTERQELTRQVYAEAEAQVQETGPAELYVLAGDWPAGVVGIVASRLLGRYHRPFVLIGGEGAIRKGSARSIKGFNITELLEAAREHLEQSGGHARAAGLSVKAEKIEDLREALLKLARERIKPEDLEREERVDARLSVDELTPELYQEVGRLEPYGMDNPEPLFFVTGEVAEVRKVGADERHVKLKLRGEERTIQAIGFGLSHAPLQVGQAVEVVARLRENVWQGRVSPELFLEGVRELEGGAVVGRE
jgi:single-stranded-DNA-specific exonuclease